MRPPALALVKLAITVSFLSSSYAASPPIPSKPAASSAPAPASPSPPPPGPSSPASAPGTPATSIPPDPDPARFVNAFIGTTNGGHVFPGATIPHGMIKVGMDTDSPGNHAGYDGDPQFNVTGFSQLHDSGTGGAVPLSNFKIFPIASCSSFETCPVTIANRRVLRKVLSNGLPDDAASPGYFATNLTSNVHAELTSTRRTALHRYTFPPGTTNPRILVDITNDGQKSSTNAEGTIDPVSARVKGGAEFAASFGPGRYKAFTCVDFKGQGYQLGKPTEYGVWLGNFPVRGTTDLLQVYYGFVSEMGALLTFPPPPSPTTPTTILVRVGVSFISSAQACANAEEEIPDFDFERVHKASRGEWNDLLGRVRVDDASLGDGGEAKALFYSSLYRTHISPADYTGENPKWNSSEPYFDSLYCNWDTYRTLYPLMAMHDPITFSRVVRGMIDIQKHEGWLPECRGATAQHFIQGGSNGDPILGEFYVKFASHAKALGVSPEDLYTALLADAELQPPNWNLQGRQVNLWKQLGYIPQDMFDAGGANTKQVSRTVEHAFNDFAISQVSKALGKTADKEKYLKRSGNFANVWNPNITVPGAPNIVGMMQPRFADGTFNFTDPRHCSIHDPTGATCFLNAARRDGFYEGSPIIYSQYAPHDTAKLIQLQGGVDSFIQRLDFIFAQAYFESTDEPSQQMPFMYHYANRPGLSTQRSRQVIAQFFNTSRNGLPGNDDSGAMGSYAAFYLLGMYPLPATQQVLISSPYFPKISFFNPLFNTTTTIIANGFKGNPADGTGGNVFVKSVTINGKPWHSNCFINWDVFVAGSTVELELTDDINVTCGNDTSALPPSVSTGGYD
ncbi:glycoside hydrolase family 92 protein [Panaeolus papilionaceus]|nr:glycoside hydrolase family 92 protein [Panaeolus papilionaceus]